jgi:CDP-6-deoxy-D-xylo-4-hexulose-3-dehydrase
MKTIHIGETMHSGGGHRAGADRIMNEAVFIGTYPGLTPAMLEYMAETIRAFVKGK